MRSTFVTLLAALLISESLGAQSLEETYAKLCSDPVNAKSEACQILATSLVTKIQTQQTAPKQPAINAQPDQATQALWRKRWGVLLDMAGKETFNVAGPGLGFTLEQKLSMLNGRVRTEWRIPGEELVNSSMGPDGSWVEGSTTRWDASSERLITTFPPPATTVVYSAAQPDGSVQTLEATYGGMTYRGATYRISSGRYENVSEKKENGNWVEVTRTQTVEYSPERLAQQRLTIQLEDQQRVQQLAQQQQAERQEKRAKSSERAAMFNSVVQGVAQGFAEVDTGGYAEAQANLDASVANINAAAAAERQQQALAQQQAQARAAEEQRAQLAENARWVAEKEQAAAEYRSGQVEAAAAREEASVLAANAEAAAERARRAEAQRQQAAADAKGSVMDQKPPASAGASVLGGPKESGRGGSTCNEELACRKTCAGDAVAVTECVKQCARESACRVGIQ